ncbi:MAG TPA: PqqD family peptide modification chaperone [Pyrinomonadaceae bacterium]
MRTPKARSDGLVIKKLPDEVLVYDLENNQAHCLNQAAALVWSHCDGRNSVEEIAGLVEAEAEGIFTEEVVWHALAQLERFSLLEERIEVPGEIALLSRRELGRRLGLATITALPFILTIVAPEEASAASCRATGNSCAVNAQCCSGLCISGTCACLGQNFPCTTDAQCCSNRCASANNKCLP